VFHGKEAAKVVGKHLRQANCVPLGKQSWTIANIPVFVLPCWSAANQNPPLLEASAGASSGGTGDLGVDRAELGGLVPPLG
jgi:hypothetical protein